MKNDPKTNDIQPYIQSWTDLVDAEKVIAHHPFVIGDFIARQVEEWREAKIQELEFRFGRLPQEERTSLRIEEVSIRVVSNSKTNRKCRRLIPSAMQFLRGTDFHQLIVFSMTHKFHCISLYQIFI